MVIWIVDLDTRHLIVSYSNDSVYQMSGIPVPTVVVEKHKKAKCIEGFKKSWGIPKFTDFLN